MSQNGMQVGLDASAWWKGTLVAFWFHIGTQGHIRGPWPLPGTGPATSRFPGGLTTAELTVGGHCGCCDQVLKALNQQAGELEAGKC